MDVKSRTGRCQAPRVDRDHKPWHEHRYQSAKPATRAPFQDIGGRGNAGGGFAHTGGDLAGPADVLRREDAAEVPDRRFLGGNREAPGGANFEPFDLSRPDRLIGPVPEDQRGDSGSHACSRGAGATVVDDGTAGRKDGRVANRTHNLYVVELLDVGKVIRARANQRSLA
jgi:hypothetical protein